MTWANGVGGVWVLRSSSSVGEWTCVRREEGCEMKVVTDLEGGWGYVSCLPAAFV